MGEAPGTRNLLSQGKVAAEVGGVALVQQVLHAGLDAKAFGET